MRDDTQGTGVDLQQASYNTITSLIQNSCSGSAQITFQLLVPILKTLENSLAPELKGNERNNDLQDLLCGVLQVSIIKAGSLISKSEADKILNLII